MRPRRNWTGRILCALAIGPATAAAPLFGQEPAPATSQKPSSALARFKGRAPVSNDILRVTLPRPAQTDLPNGLRLMVMEDRQLPQVTFQIIIRGAGGYYDPPDQAGLASATAALMREGTSTRTSADISASLEMIAGNLTVTTTASSPHASIVGSALTEDLAAVLDVTADILLNPTFPPTEWQRFKVRTRGLLDQQRTQPAFLASEMLNRTLFGDHPAARVTTSPSALDAMSPEALRQFHRGRYVPDFAAAAFAGDISLAEAKALVEDKFRSWRKAGAPPPRTTEPPAVGASKVVLVDRPGSVQTTLVIGTQSLPRIDPEHAPLTVANRVLGGPRGRLFRHLREEKGYTYGVSSSLSAGQHRGLWYAMTSVRTEITEQALDALLTEIAKLRDDPIPGKELDDMKRAIVASFALSLENPAQVLGYYVDSWLYGLPPDYWVSYPARIERVTAGKAQAAARQYLDRSRLHIVAIGDAPRITDILQKSGQLEIYDADGKRMK